jgi:hypothetical protein
VWFRFKVGEGDRPRVLATVQGLRSLRIPVEARQCPAWRAEIYNPYGEGGTYPPYGNSGFFDGVGYGATGASSTGPAQRYDTGIDYTGVWALQLSLARDTLTTCSAHLPEEARFTARFSIATKAPGSQKEADQDEREPGKAATESPAATPGQPSTEPSAEPDEPTAAEKYTTPVREGQPAWVYPVTAVGLVLLAAGLGLAVRLRVRRRRRGW